MCSSGAPSLSEFVPIPGVEPVPVEQSGMVTRSLRRFAEGHSVPPPHSALGLAELPGSPQLPRLLLCDTGLMACLSFPLPKNRDGHGGEGVMGGKRQACAQPRVKYSANLSYQSGGNLENIPEAAGIPTIAIKRK